MLHRHTTAVNALDAAAASSILVLALITSPTGAGRSGA